MKTVVKLKGPRIEDCRSLAAMFLRVCGWSPPPGELLQAFERRTEKQQSYVNRAIGASSWQSVAGAIGVHYNTLKNTCKETMGAMQKDILQLPRYDGGRPKGRGYGRTK